MTGTKVSGFIGLFLLVGQIANAQEFYVGADLSYVNELEDCGATHKDRNGQEADPYELFAAEGAGLVRLRLWHDPSWTSYSNLEDVKRSIARAKVEGMQVMLDFHYSDFWADPGRQWRPAAWEDITDDAVLADSMYAYTYQVLSVLNDDGLLPEMVQIGNETNGNILMSRNGADIGSGSPGLYPVDWSRQVSLLQKGIEAVRDLNQLLGKEMKTLIHIANPLGADAWFRSAESNGLNGFDIIGLSYYPQWHELGVRELAESVSELKVQFGKEVMIVETGYPWTGNGQDQANNVLNFDSRLFTYSNQLSQEVQRDFMIELSWLVKEHGGLGVIYWEPAWITSSCQTYWGTGSHWENAALFDFEGILHRGADFLSYDYEQKPAALDDQEATFTVDMTTIDTDNGVFVTGDFTGTNEWELIPMTNTTGELYEYTTTIPGRTDGAYIFYNNDVWSNAYQETVPENCARHWETHREFRVRGEATEFYFSWGRCDQTPNEIVLGIDQEELSIYPTLVRDFITIEGSNTIEITGLTDLKGNCFSVNSNGANKFNVQHLEPGLYLLRVKSESGQFAFKFIKQ